MAFTLLLIPHVLAGIVCLVCSVIALSSTKGGSLHRQVGRYFFYGMTIIFISAIPMAVLTHNLFLFLIALFSYYLAYTGWRYAKRRQKPATLSDFLVAGSMTLISIFMVVVAFFYLKLQTNEAIVLLVFGLISLSFAPNDLRFYFNKTPAYKPRIERHLSAMIGGMIAVYTAFMVTNFGFLPALVCWLGPTVVLTPVIAYWTYRVRSQ